MLRLVVGYVAVLERGHLTSGQRIKDSCQKRSFLGYSSSVAKSVEHGKKCSD